MDRRASHRARLRAGLVLSCALGALCQPAAAQEASRVEGTPVALPAVTITGDRPGTAATTPTVLTRRVTRTDLDAAQVQDVDDIDRLDPAVSYSEGTRSFNVRGLDRARVLTTIDGVRVPWIEDGARGLQGGVSGVDFDTLSAIDIVKGADSSVFGSGALGGVVSLRTLNPEDLLDGKTFGGLSKGFYDSKDRSWSVEQALAARFGDTYALFQGGYRQGHEIENEGDRGGFGPLRTEKEPRDYDRQNYLFKLRQHVDGGHVFGLTAESFDRDDEIDNATSSITTYRAGTAKVDETEKRQRLSASYEYVPEEADGLISAADAVVYWQKQEIDSDFTATRLTRQIGAYGRLTERDQTTFGGAGNAVASFATGDVGHDVGFGGEIFASRATQSSTGFDNCPPPPYPPAFFTCNFLHTNQSDMPDVDGTTLGLYVQDEIGFFADQLRLTPGLRFDWYRETPQETDAFRENPTARGLPDESSDEALSPKLRAEFDMALDVTLYGQWARGFRAPTATELYLSYGGPGTYLRIGNPDLKAETSDGFEGGVLFGDDSFGGSMSAFYNRYADFIDDVSVTPASIGVPAGLYPNGITRNINRASVEIYGAEATVRWQIDPNWRSWASLGAYIGRDRETGVHLNSIPAAKGILGLGYSAGEWGTDLVLTAAAARTKTESAITETPSYGLVDVSGWWEPKAVEGLKVKAGVYNLFDATYYDALDIPDSTTLRKLYYSEPGRTFKATVSYKF